MKNKIYKIIISILCLLFINFPISYTLTNIKYVFWFIGIVFLILCFVNKNKKILRCKIFNEKNYFKIILILSIITRLGIVLLLNSRVTQYSDFEIALNTAYSGNITDGYHLIFSHWDLYPLIMNCFCKIFGNYQIVTLIFNAIVNVLTCVMIYLIGNRIFERKKYGFIASLIYILWPGNILYTLILTQEHVGILLILIAIYLFLKTEERVEKKYKLAIVNYIMLGVIIGISIFFKNFSYVLFIAFAMYHILLLFTKIKKLSFVKKIIPLYVIMIIVFIAIQNLMYLILDNKAGKPVSRNLLPYTLNIGLRGDGHWDRTNSYRYRDLAKDNDYDFAKTNETIMEELMDYIKKKDSPLWTYNFWNNKAKVIFNEDEGRMHFIKMSFVENSKIRSIIEKHIEPFNNIFLTVVSFLCVISALYMCYNRNIKLILTILIVHGASLIFLLIESQNRYKYPLLPFMCIIASIGLVYLVKIIKKLLTKKDKFV